MKIIMAFLRKAFILSIAIVILASFLGFTPQAFAGILASQPDDSFTFSSCPTVFGTNCSDTSDYSSQSFIPSAGTLDEFKFSASAPVGTFFAVQFNNLTAGGGLKFFAPNNYVAGKTEGNGAMTDYTLRASDFSSPIIFNGTDTWSVQFFAYKNFFNCGVMSCYHVYDVKGDHNNNQYFIITDLTTPPPTEDCTENCFSSVLFLPGIKGSVLKKNSDTLWPPTLFNINDVSQLALSSDGESVNDIHTDGILDTFLGTPIYAPFSNFMDGLVADETIEEWLPFAYDWRFLPDTIIGNGVKTESETLDVIEKIEELAENSKTGKVTIVAHSMGGLLGKSIIKKLEDEGKDELIDSFVMIGTPQLGTPQAAGAMLHGDSEGIVPVLIAHPADMRSIAQNMPSAYSLLPSPRYFDEVSDPVIKFREDAPFTQAWRDFWGTSINTYPDFLSFVTGMGVARDKPVPDMLKDPEVLRPELMTDAADFHDTYDDYQFPEHIRVVQVAGWGSPTTKNVEYKRNHGIPGYKTNFTREGDKTVVYPSAISSAADETYYFNLDLFRDPDNKVAQHRDLLSTNPIRNLLESVIKKENVIETNIISSTKPQVTDLNDQLVVSTNSPVVLGAHDQFGNFTGIDPDQDLSAGVLSISENIPGSTFLYTSEAQYIFLPKEGVYDFLYKGTGNGPTTVEIESFAADTTAPVASYTEIPTTPNTTAAFTVEAAAPENTEITLDLNGNGETKIVPADGTPTTPLSLNELILLIKEKVSALDIKDKLKQNLLKQISNLEKKIENKKQKNLKALANLEKNIYKEEIKGKINTADAGGIISLLDILEAQAENITLDALILSDLESKIQSLVINNNLKNDLLKRVEKLEKKQVLVKTLSNLAKNITKKAEKGKMSDTDTQMLIDILNQIDTIL